VRLLERNRRTLREQGIRWRITGVANRRIGWISDANGLDLEPILQGTPARPGIRTQDIRGWLKASAADVLFEASSLNPSDGQPAIDHIRAALETGAHAITANKGPLVHAYEELRSLAAAKQRSFLFESTVMDGMPIFSLFQRDLPLVCLKGFRGILNSTSNLILSGIESGLSYEQSLEQARQLGVAETDPGHDVDGWDAAVKTAVLIRVLMGHAIELGEVEREGISRLKEEAIRAARTQGRPYKSLCQAWREDGRVLARVSPQQIPLSDPLAWVEGTSSMVEFETDLLPGFAIREDHPGVDATAYGMLSDFVRAVGPPAQAAGGDATAGGDGEVQS
jgi:homoserine dehydrogenase